MKIFHKSLPAFSLPEVMITMGIIGVVSVMVLPTLMANTKAHHFRARFKKTIATLNQAGLMSKAQFEFDFADTSQPCNADKKLAETESPEEVMTFCSLLNGTLTGKTYYGEVDDLSRMVNGQAVKYELVNYETIPATSNIWHAYALADGALVIFSTNAHSCELAQGQKISKDWILTHTQCRGYIDVNGVTLPNKEVTCSVGTTDITVDEPCVVKSDAQHMTDVFPIIFHGTTVEPGSNAAKYVLMTAK